MSIHQKTLFIIGATLLTIIVVIFFASQLILLNSFGDLEARDTVQNTQRAINALDNNLASMLSRSYDWGHWDDTYQFIQDGNPAYIESNMGDTTFITNELNFMLFVNNAGEIVFGKSFDLAAQQEVPISESLYPHLVVGSPLLRPVEPDLNGISGILMLPEGPVLVVSSAILTNEQQGPSQGSLIWGRFLDVAEIEALAQSTQLAIQIYPFPNAPHEVRNDLLEQAAPVVQPRDQNIVVGYSRLSDIYGDPALILQVEIPRHIYDKGYDSLTYFLFALLLIGIVFVSMALLLLDKMVLSRVTRLSNAITDIRTTGNLSTPILVQGNDEISSLGYGMKALLETLGQYQANLQNAHDKLEARVKERTDELSQANIQLKQQIAERESIQNQLLQARDQALEALRLKTQILGNISHDARTPLNVIMLRTEVLRRGRYGAIAPEQDKVLSSILLNAQELLNFVNNLLAQAQFGGENAKVVQVDFEPKALLQKIENGMLPLAEKKGLQFIIEVTPELDTVLYGDPERLKQMCVNLVDNAIKFTDQGTITIRAYQVNEAQWAIAVSDTGIGIPQSARAEIFEAFWQVDGSITRTANRGVGLGLSIVKHLSLLMNGHITVQSQEGVGSTFTVTLPLTQRQT